MCTTRRPARGFTMIELIIFIMIVGIAVVGTISLLSVTSGRSADPQIRKQALTIAESLLEEIELAHFTLCDPTDATADVAAHASDCSSVVEDWGPEAGNSRPYDNVNDYVNSSTHVGSYTTDANGGSFPSNYVATVSIKTESGLGPSGGVIMSDNTPANMNALRIKVRVTYPPNNDFVELDGYRTRYAPNSLP
ncbi:MAG: type II secretion system protein [Pseudomonadota bacterium]